LKEIAMKRSNTWTLSAIVVTTLFATAPTISSAMDDATSELPPELTQGNITYITGGIGHDEAMAMRRQEAQYPLSLEFVKRAGPVGEYLAGVNVTIKDRQGKTKLETVADGPIVLARLPVGKYTVSAELDGQIKNRDVVIVTQKPERLVFEW
jgi:hypothetical protein